MAAGESVSSKWSSLDRQSELSARVIRGDHDDGGDDEDRQSDVGIGFADEGGIVDDKPRKRNKKGGRNTLSQLSSALTKFVPLMDVLTVNSG